MSSIPIGPACVRLSRAAFVGVVSMDWNLLLRRSQSRNCPLLQSFSSGRVFVSFGWILEAKDHNVLSKSARKRRSVHRFCPLGRLRFSYLRLDQSALPLNVASFSFSAVDLEHWSH